jgi:hypothetical protein
MTRRPGDYAQSEQHELADGLLNWVREEHWRRRLAPYLSRARSKGNTWPGGKALYLKWPSNNYTTLDDLYRDYLWDMAFSDCSEVLPISTKWACGCKSILCVQARKCTLLCTLFISGHRDSQDLWLFFCIRTWYAVRAPPLRRKKKLSLWYLFCQNFCSIQTFNLLWVCESLASSNCVDSDN